MLIISIFPFNLSFRYGFVDFPSTELATDAQKLMTGKMVDKCKIVVTFAGQENKPKDENGNICTSCFEICVCDVNISGNSP